ncbi:tRNA (guanosine(37)-N1)-methyltransferase TrmD [Pilimelia columellifera]|uniref:tRNA (guanine-N(1)-)-methyltransferase n=1 Tax=Pilimelia columellifera subsp. columellifera TaxID=706583 RepID=A0ABP6AEX8_9ACTN
MKIDIVSIFPDYFAPLELSLIGRSHAAGLIDVRLHDLRDWTHDLHRTVDDTPYGGGPGMVMRPEPWGEALDHLLAGMDDSTVPGAPASPRLIVPSPAGVPFSQSLAAELAAESRLLFACGRYEGIDQRVLEHYAARTRVTEVSLGDYVLFGGEVAVLVMLEAVIRLVPGVLGNADSLAEESHADGLLEAPMYTKPARWRELATPDVLRSGDHGRIAQWRREQSLLRTAQRRPDLLARQGPSTLTKQDIAFLAEAGFQVPAPDVAE